MACARNNLTVSREIYAVLVRRRESMKQNYRGRQPSLNDALASLINSDLTQDRNYAKYAKKDKLARMINKTLIG